MAATFILSLDCEGKWGVADHLDQRAHAELSDDRLRAAYRDIIRLLTKYDVRATFAFVGLFSQSKANFSKLRPLIDELAVSHPSFLGPALSDADDGSREGWSGEWAVEQVASAPQNHEIAYHGSSHIPWDQLTSATLKRELELLVELEGPVRSSKTMVFPRNRVAHQTELVRVGIHGYRGERTRSRAANLLAEFNPLLRSELQPEPAIPTRIPAGFFVNYQNGLRKCVPKRLSKFRAEHAFAHANRTDGIVHFWLHPENVASAPATLGNLEDILCIAARERDMGRCTIQTQLDYCKGLTA